METQTEERPAPQPVYQVEKPAAPAIEAQEITYTAGPGDPLAVDWNGKRFVSGVARMIDDPVLLDKVNTNPHFAFNGQDKAKEAEAKREEEAKRAEDEREMVLKQEAEHMKARHEREAADLAARHKAEADRMDVRAKGAVKSPPAAPTHEDEIDGKPKTAAEVEAERNRRTPTEAALANQRRGALPDQVGQNSVNEPV